MMITPVRNGVIIMAVTPLVHHGDVFERFSDELREVVRLAAGAAKDGPICSEHLLWAIATRDRTDAARALRAAGAAVAVIERVIGERGQSGSGKGFTPNAKRALEGAARLAQELGDLDVSVDHLLVAVISNPNSGGAAVLRSLNVESASILRLSFGDEPQGAEPRAAIARLIGAFGSVQVVGGSPGGLARSGTESAPMGSDARLGRPLLDFFTGSAAEDAKSWLDAYYNGRRDLLERADQLGWLYSGSHFERLSDVDNPNAFTSKDFVAVSMLGVNLPAHAAIWILGEGGAEFSELLRGIGPDRPITDSEVSEEMLCDEAPAGRLWHRLCELDDIGAVKAGKLLAAKRPSLIPVWDQHVQDALQPPAGRFWQAMRAGILEAQDEIAAVVRAVGLDVPLLRAADVVVWMHQHGQKWLADSKARPETA